MLLKPSVLHNDYSHSPDQAPLPSEETQSAPSVTKPISPPQHPSAIINPGYLPDDFITSVVHYILISYDMSISGPNCFRRRVTAFLTYADHRGGRFSPAKKPRGLVWGTPTILWDDLDKYLCLKKKLVTRWLVGCAKSLWFFEKSGTPQDRPNIGICLIRPIDWQATRHLIDDYAYPKTSARFCTFTI
ncbi:hypothetical protein A0H81_02221 [Grifola frondosa]|uniref:Uncharacterized protein n=1 Tax=Grifola frondosa TaxID=5627 RepID=A0A1C7MTK0_GRIFR|nr:hypothetical protein A0H81_02221 [Grifola frondosa]